MVMIGEFGAAARDADDATEPDTFKFYGETFAVADRVGAMPLLRFAAVADAGAQAEEMEGLAAMHELLRDCLVAEPITAEVDGESKIVAHGWAHFQRVAASNKAEAEELMEVCGAIYQVVSGRPTRQPSVSTAGLSTTGASSKVSSSSEVSLPPIQQDPRIQALVPVAEVGLSLVG
jgi:hypothetical protein